MIAAKANYKNTQTQTKHVCKGCGHKEETTRPGRMPKKTQNTRDHNDNTRYLSADLKANKASANNLININTELKTWEP